MNTKDLKEWFKRVPMYKTLIQNYNDTISYYRDCLSSDEWCIELVKIQEEKLAVQTSRKNLAPQAIEFDLKNIGKKKAKEEIQKYTDKRNSIYRKMYLLDKAFEYLESIDPERAYVIECKFINKLSWNDTEINFNNKYRIEKMVGYDYLRHLIPGGLEYMIEYINSIPWNKINYFHKFKKEYLKVNIECENK